LAVPVVVPQDAIAPVRDEQILPAIVVVVAGANALAPARMRDAGFHRHIGEGAVAIVLIQAADRRLARRPLRFQASAVYQKDVQPAVVVVIEEGASAAGGFQQVFVLALAAEDRFRAQAGLACYVDELHTERQPRDQLVERKYRHGGTQRPDEAASGDSS